MVFEYIIVEHPNKKDAEKGALEKILKGPKLVVARDQEHAKTLALLAFGQEQEAIFEETRIEVIVRPFK